LPDIYADECALILIACQGCGHEYPVAMSISTGWAKAMAQGSGGTFRTLAERIRDGSIHYGDPPNTGCCAAGATMNSEPKRVLEYWHKPGRIKWERDPTLEIDVDGWAEAGTIEIKDGE
jgi:hypothetical protein